MSSFQTPEMIKVSDVWRHAAGYFMFSPVDSNQENVLQLVQMSSLINRTAEVECHLLQQLSVVEGSDMLLYMLCFM